MKQDLAIRAVRRAYRLLGLSCPQQYDNKPVQAVVSAENFNQKLAEIIMAGKACMVSRLGTSEAACILNHLEISAMEASSPLRRFHEAQRGARQAWDPGVAALLSNNAGFFPPTDDCLSRFAQLFIDDLRKIDCIGVWGFVPGEEFLVKKFCPSVIRFKPTSVEPYYFSQPWSARLEGLRVLVIHPFADSITSQFARREKIFPESRVLPDFELLAIPAVQTLAGNNAGFASWFDALDWMKSEVSRLNFDVALIGAGAYGLPLSAHVKRCGKISIHMGGALQILFGIKGKRWDNMPDVSRFYNDAWIRPSENERLCGAEKVEQGCYW